MGAICSACNKDGEPYSLYSIEKQSGGGWSSPEMILDENENWGSADQLDIEVSYLPSIVR
jgi:hypothetical protein